MSKIAGAEQLTDAQLQSELLRGGKLVYYHYVISLLIVTLSRTSEVRFIPAGASRVTPGLPYTLISAVLGWWGFPWGFIRTPVAIAKNFGGGTDVTADVLARLAGNSAVQQAGAAGPAMRPTAQPAVQPVPPAVADQVTAKRTYQWPDRLGYYVTFARAGYPPVELEVPKDWYDYLQPQMRGQLQMQGNAFMNFQVTQ